MARIAGLGKIGLPRLSENMNPEDARALRNYLYQMQEQFRRARASSGFIFSLSLGRPILPRPAMLAMVHPSSSIQFPFAPLKVLARLRRVICP